LKISAFRTIMQFVPKPPRYLLQWKHFLIKLWVHFVGAWWITWWITNWVTNYLTKCVHFFENFTERFPAVGLKLHWGAQNPSRDGALACGFPRKWKLWGTRWILLTPPLPPRTCPRVPSINLRDFVLLSRTRSTHHQKSSVGLLLPKPVSESATKKIQFSCYPFISFFFFQLFSLVRNR
jgi:hypothetical protein